MSFWHRPAIEEVLIVLVGIIAFSVYIGVRGGDEGSVVDVTPAAPATETPTPTPTPSTPTPTPTSTPSPTVVPTATPEPAVTSPDECDFGDVASNVRAAIVLVDTETGSGTAFHIGGGRYVTAAHVIQDEAGQTALRITLYTDGRYWPATVEREGSYSRFSLERDLAVLQAEAIPAVLEIRSPTEDDTDIDVRAFGYPWSSVGDRGTAVPLQTSKGVVSAVTVADGIAIVQTDAGVDRGMSGGPLVDECGYALSVASFILNTDDVDDPGDFAVFISVAELANLD